MTLPRRPTVADIRALKGRRKLTMLFVETPDEARAAAEAGIDMLSIIDPLWTPEMREAAGPCFVQVGLLYGELCTYEDYLRAAHRAIRIGGDSVYCAASLDTVRRLAAEGIPVVGHVGLIPSKCTWTGGFRAVGKTAEAALKLYDEVRAYEAAGAIAVEIEVVPAEVATEISRRVGILLWSMGAGAGCDAQYLFANDILGYTEGHIPRHSKVYRDFAAEYGRLQAERAAAFREFVADVDSGAYPEDRHILHMAPEELDGFLEGLERRGA